MSVRGLLWRSGAALSLPVLLFAAALTGATPVEAQEVFRTGAGNAIFDQRLDQLIQSDDYLLITRDTLIDAGDVIPRDALVLDARLTLEGTIRGDLVAVDASVFLRPSARVTGDVYNIGGGLYASALATIGGEARDRPLERYEVVPVDGGFRIVARTTEPRLQLDGLYGLRAPRYDRVNGAWLRWSGAYHLPGIPGITLAPGIQPWIVAGIGYRTELGEPTGRLGIELRRGALTLEIAAERVTLTTEEWIRGHARNSLAFLAVGTDARDYYGADVYYAELRRRFEGPGWEFVPHLRAQFEEGDGLTAGGPFVFLDDEPFRRNLIVEDGVIASAILLLEGEWVGASSAVDGFATLELADGAVAGDFGFGRFAMAAEWKMAALWNHAIELEWFVQAVLPGTESLPRRRWSVVGGSGTLSTFELARFRGDRVVFLESEYIIPLPERIALPILGAPDLELSHQVGMAWTAETEREFRQNIGLDLQFFVLEVGVVTDPADAVDSFEFSAGVSWPFGDDRPWEGR